jgi:hypothetical protein
VESVVSKIQETGQHAAKKTDLLFARTRDAGEAFVDEVLGAGRDLLVFVRTEAKGWKRFLTQRSSLLQSEARVVLTVPALERELLTRVDGTLRTIDAKVRARLQELEKHSAKSVRRRGASNGKGTAAAARKSKSSGASKSASGTSASLRH